MLLPGVTTLSRDFYRRPILGASNHFYLYLFIALNLSLLELGKHRKTFKGFYLANKFSQYHIRIMQQNTNLGGNQINNPNYQQTQ